MKCVFCLLMAMAMGMILFGCGEGIMTAEERQLAYCGEGQESVILKYLTAPKEADVLLQLANHQALKKGRYTVQEATAFIDTIEMYVHKIEDGPISGAQLVAFVMGKLKDFKEAYGAELLILSQYATDLKVPDILTMCDRDLLLKHIAKQRTYVLSMF